jgi:transcriptional regulator GlxA family with amidase domain
MRHVSILVPEDAVLAAIDDPRVLFTGVNDFLVAGGKKPEYNVQFAGLTSEVKLHNGKFSVHTDILLSDVKKTDLVIIPALTGDIEKALALNTAFLPWIIEQYKNGAEVVSLCSGAFFLASTGLLNRKTCSTHWIHANSFRKMFPQVTLAEGKIITEENGIYTSGGATSYWNLLLYLVEKHAGRDMAITASKYYALDIARNSQSAFIIFKGQRAHEDDDIRKAQDFIETNFQEKITVDQLAATFAIGRRNFERRFKKATANTVTEYIQRVKIEAAKMSLESSKNNINEVVYNVGYTDPKAFRTTFKKITGLSPMQYRNKYNRTPQISM